MFQMQFILIAIFLAAVFIPWFWRRSPQSDFFLAGRQASSSTVAGSLLATCLGASATIGVAGRAYSMGWSAFWWLGAGSIGLVLLGLFFAEPMRRRPTTLTLPQWAGDSYGLPARILSAALIAIMWLAVVAAQLVAAGTLFHSLTGWPLMLGIGLSAAVVICYTAIGGQRSVLRTDMLQIALILLSITLPLAFLHKLGTTGAPPLPSPNDFFFSGNLGLGSWLALLTVVGGMYVVGPDLCSRVLLARDLRSARRGTLLAGLALLPCSLVIVYLGVYLKHSGVVLGSPRDALPWLITEAHLFPAWIGHLISIGMLAALFSSADTCLLTAASVLELDIFGRKHSASLQDRLARILVVVLGLASALIAHFHPHIIRNLLLAYAFYSGGLLVPLLLLGHPRFSQQIPRPWIWTGMSAGGLVPVVLLLTHRTADFAIAGAIGALACLGIILVGRLRALRTA
jgi:SSS family solute:Na+ symporter